MASIGGGSSGPKNVSVSNLVSTTDNSSQAVFSEIQTASAQVQALSQDLTALVAELQLVSQQLSDHAKGKPQAPGSGATQEAKDKYAAALKEWQQKGATLEAQLVSVTGRLQSKQRELDTKQNELQSLQNTKLPMAKAKDRAQLEAQLEQANKSADSARDAALRLEKSLAGGADLVDEKRKLLRRPPVAGGSGLPPANVP